MNTLVSTSLPLPRQRTAAVPSTLAPATRTAIKLLQDIEGGSLRLVLPDGQHILLGHGAERATLEVNDERVFRRVLAEGDIGFGESWIAGDWHSEQPAELLTLCSPKTASSWRARCTAAGLPVLGHRLRHLLRSNTRAGSKRNILAHYDLGNDFYKLWLDPSMSYSSALFGTDPQQSLQQAQRQKYLRLLEMLDPKPG
jgi:cyclopropane-fatty-acyl-phospholipid synthase